MPIPPYQDVHLWRDGRRVEDAVAVEEPLEIRVLGRPLAVLMRTPGNDDELAAGLLWTEGLISDSAAVLDVHACENVEPVAAGNVLEVDLAPTIHIDFARMQRNLYAPAACGLCGKASIDQVRQRGPNLGIGPHVLRATLFALPEAMRAAQSGFARTGGLHAAALFDAAGRLLCIREDVGRHNAVDKVIGWALFEDRLPLADHLLLVSGRAGFEITQKAWMAGIGLVAAVSAPSSLAVQMAVESGMTLVGFLRGDTMNVYANPQRIES